MAKARVLLVEDDALQANETRALLTKTGYEVLWAQDGINAIKQVKSEKPDIILLDVVLPGLDGYEVCRWLKLEESTKGIPVIMLTVKKDLADKVSGLQIGADDYLPKPYNELELNARIYASLRTKALQDELKAKNNQLEELLYKVEYMAITDVLTGLFNRRRFHDVVGKEFERAKRYAMPLSIIMLDIDHFKQVNDRYGHQAGDGVLKQISEIILKSIREVDTASRFGGEEFIVVLPNTDRKDALTVAERMRKTISETAFPDVPDTRVTVSLGVAGIPDDLIATEEQMVRCADYALYTSKKGGRNRIEVCDGLTLKRRLSEGAD
ncbi:MAG: diguanylate cyclase [Thermodesulfovibrionales bacterium]